MHKYIFFLAGVLMLMPSCRYRHGRHISGNGPTVTEMRNITGFTGVETRGSINIIVSQGSYSVKVESDQSLLQYIETVVENGRLIVRFRNDVSIGDYHDAEVYVSAPELNTFETRGSGNIKGEEKISDKNKISVIVSASGDIELKLDCPVIETKTHGSGGIKLDGESKNIFCEVNASGDVEASGLKAETAKVSIHGSGNAEVFASESLDAEIFASGDVHYKGEPKITSSVHGSGEVSKMD